MFSAVPTCVVHSLLHHTVCSPLCHSEEMKGGISSSLSFLEKKCILPRCHFPATPLIRRVEPHPEPALLRPDSCCSDDSSGTDHHCRKNDPLKAVTLLSAFKLYLQHSC